MSLKQMLILCLMLTPCAQAKQKHRFTLVLDPAGDAHNPGRQIQGQYERTIAFTCAQALKKELEQKASDLLILFTRLPGQQADQLQKAHFSNQLPADLYVSLHIYETNQLKNQLHIYYYDNQQLPPASTSLRCTPLHKAHTVHATRTKHAAHHITEGVSYPMLQRKCDIHQPIGMPCVPCKGIVAPAVCIEVGLTKPDNWMTLLTPLTEAVYTLCLNLNDI